MKRTMIQSMAILGLAAFAAIPAYSSSVPREEQRLTALLDAETTPLADAMEQELVALEAPGRGDELWYLKRLRVRVQAKAGVEVPFLSKLEIVPEIELLWQRENPEGLAGYKP